MKNEQTAVIKDMEFLLNELHKEWERPGEEKGITQTTLPAFRAGLAHPTDLVVPVSTLG
jgi:hypothetical protein